MSSGVWNILCLKQQPSLCCLKTCVHILFRPQITDKPVCFNEQAEVFLRSRHEICNQETDAPHVPLYTPGKYIHSDIHSV